MKKHYCLAIIIILVSVFQFCTGTRKAAIKPSKITYIGNVQPILQAKCTPCHFPPQGNKKPLNTFVAVKNEVDEMLVRINKNPGEKGFMPMKHPKLSDSTINVIAQWKADGLLEQ